MKKTVYPMPISFGLGLLLMGTVAWLVSAMLQVFPAILEIHWLVLLIPAVLCSVGALIAHLCAKGRTGIYLLSYGINAIGSGCAVGVLMGVKGMISTLILVQSLLPALLLGILCWAFLAFIDYYPGIVTLLFVVLSVILLIVGFVIWVKVMPLVGCTMVFSALFVLLFPVFVNVALDDARDTFRYLSFSGFTAFIAILFAVIIILSEGQALDGLDGFDGLGGGSLNIGRRRRYP